MRACDKIKTIGRNDLKLGTLVAEDTLSKPVNFGFQNVKDQGHKVVISNFWHPIISVERMQLPRSNLCTNALRAVFVYRSKIVPECDECHGI